MTPLATLFSFAGPAASPDAAAAGLPAAAPETGAETDDEDFGSLLAAALAGLTPQVQSVPTASVPQTPPAGGLSSAAAPATRPENTSVVEGIPQPTPPMTSGAFAAAVPQLATALSPAAPAPAPTVSAAPVATTRAAADPAPAVTTTTRQTPAATAVSSQPIAEGVRFVGTPPAAAEAPAPAPNTTDPTQPPAQPADPTATDPQQPTPPGETVVEPEADVALPVEVPTPTLSELVQDRIQTTLLTRPEGLLGTTTDRQLVPTPAAREPVPTNTVPPTSNLVPPGPATPGPLAQTPVPQVAVPTRPLEPTAPLAPPTTSTPSIAPAATVAAGGTPAVPTLVPAQPTQLAPVPVNPSTPVAAPTGVDRPVDPVEAPAAVAAVPTLTETATSQVREQFADVVGEIGDRPPAKGPTLDAELTSVVPFETRLLATRPAEGPTVVGPGAAVRPAPAVQVADAIVTRAEVLGRGEQAEFRLRLDPPELGKIDVRVHRTANGVHADLTVADEGVRQMIESQLPDLRQRLEAAGLSVDRFNLTAQDGSAGGGRHERFDPEFPADRRPARRAATAAVPKAYVAPAPGGRLDISV